MNEFNLSFESFDNERSLEDIVWTIEMSQGQFCLILAVCDSTKLRDNMAQKLQEICPNIEEIVLKSSDILIHPQLKDINSQKHPSAIMIHGFESVTKIDKMLTSLNQVREDLWKSFKFPIILWINGEIAKKMIRLTPDIESWASITNFSSFSGKQIDCQPEKVDRFNLNQGSEDGDRLNNNNFLIELFSRFYVLQDLGKETGFLGLY
ncbi:MAG: hypothetical protein F6K17_42115 [Okeania sp. SIO3C4]|nr:hypothetical protein [Okeania sp. SIO3C4]